MNNENVNQKIWLTAKQYLKFYQRVKEIVDSKIKTTKPLETGETT